MSTWQLRWDDCYKVGVEAIDHQHAYFAAIVNRINTAHDGGADRELLGHLLHELYYYVFYHFYSEENLMREIGYPGLPAQQQAHKAFLDSFTRKMNQWATGNLPLEPVMKGLFNWFIGHTADDDVKIGVFLRSRS